VLAADGLAGRPVTGSFGPLPVSVAASAFIFGIGTQLAGGCGSVMRQRSGVSLPGSACIPTLWNGRVRGGDRLFFVWLYRLFQSVCRALLIIRPDTLVRWHRAGFRCYRRWKLRRRIGRPRVDYELRALIRTIA
jgi:hypothetical protein